MQMCVNMCSRVLMWLVLHHSISRWQLLVAILAPVRSQARTQACMVQSLKDAARWFVSCYDLFAAIGVS
jgi:hypothetical protein